MTGENKTKKQLAIELEQMRKRIAVREVSEAARKRVEDKTRGSEERLRILFEFAPDGYYLSDLKGNFVDGNKAAEEITGYKKDELIGKSFLKLKLLSPGQIPKAAALLAKNALGQPTGPDEFILKRKGGIRVPVEIRTFPVKIKDQRLVLGIARDVTERKQAEQRLRKYYDHLEKTVEERTTELKAANETLERDITQRKQVEKTLRESEERYRLLAETVTDVIWTTDINLGFTYVSPSVTPMLGYGVEEAMALSLGELLTLESLEVAMKAFAETPSVDEVDPKNLPWSPTLELELKHKDGSRVWLEVKSTYLFDRDGRPVGFVGVGRDITERKRVEQAFKESQQKLRRMFASVSDGISVSDLNGIITDANKRMLQMLGLSSENELLGKSMFEFIPQHDHKEVRTRMEQGLKRGTLRYMENNIVRTDGYEFLCEIGASVLNDASGKPVGFIAVIRDITERKQAEEKLQKLYKHEKELRQKLEAETDKRIEFTRALVHELKTPITPVLASSELLLEELKEEPLLALAKNINQSASNLNHRIDELLDLAKGEIGMLRLSPKSVDPMQLLQELVRSVTPVALRNEQSLSLELPSSLPAIWADEGRLGQVVLNLINNAFRFTSAGGKITLRAKQNGANLVVEVQDTGRGISKKEQGRLFEPYRQLESDEGHLGGLGLGLALAKSLVELHGGQIWVKSRKGEGSTFGFSVPLEDTSQERRAETGLEL